MTHATTNNGEMLVLLMVVIVLAVYFLPAIVGATRGAHGALAIYFVNLLTGWTIIGWLACLVWARTAQSTRQPRPVVLVRDGGGQWRVHHIAAAHGHHH